MKAGRRAHSLANPTSAGAPGPARGASGPAPRGGSGRAGACSPRRLAVVVAATVLAVAGRCVRRPGRRGAVAGRRPGHRDGHRKPDSAGADTAPEKVPAYWLVASDGGIFSFGGAAFYGSTGSMTLNAPVVGMAGTADSRRATGWWPPTGGSSASATPGSTARPVPRPSTPEWSACAATPTAGVLAGGVRRRHLLLRRRPVLRLDGRSPAQSAHRLDGRHPDGGGYWLVATDGGIFAFGDAGSTARPATSP